jgi:hypothetical protein
MIRRKRKLHALDDELAKAKREHARVLREGRAREPMLDRLEQRLQDNGILLAVIESLEQTRRRRHP